VTEIEPQVTYEPVTILSDAELYSIVIEKHNKFIKDFTDEQERLEVVVNSKRTEYQRMNKELEAFETRIVVLREKRHQLYHQAKKLRIKLFEDIVDTGHIQHIENETADIENRLQNANMSSKEELYLINRISSLVNEIVQGVPELDDVHRGFLPSILDIFKTAESARKELDDMMDAPAKHKSESASIKEEFEEMESRLGWLKRRIELHKDALEYWEKMVVEGASNNE
jgi:chromosome segregation ATPase